MKPMYLKPSPSGLDWTRGLARNVLIAAVLFSFGAAAAAATIGLNFVRGPGADAPNVQNATSNSLAPADLAGAGIYQQGNWNNLGYLGTNITLVDSAGAASGVVVNWASGNCWSMSGGGTPTTQGSPDANLMNAYLDSNGSANTTFNTNLWGNSNNNKPLVHLSGLSAWMGAQGVSYYDLVIYSDGDSSDGSRGGEFWTADVNSDPANLTLGNDQVTHVFIYDRGNFTTTLNYAQVPNLVQSGLASRFGNFPGNYTVIDSLSSDSVLIRTAEYASRAPINAIQIIPRATPLLAAIAPLPSPQVFAGTTVLLRAQVAGRTPQTFQWQKNGVNLTDTGNIFGSTNTTLAISNVSGGDVASYALVVTSPVGVVTSAPAALTIVAPVLTSFPGKVVADNPYAYWRLNDSADASTNFAMAVDYAGKYHGTYANAAQNGYNGIVGPVPTDFPGFESTNTALFSANTTIRTWIMAPPLNLNTNAVTMCAWINPLTAQNGSAGLVFSRLGNDVGGLGFGGNSYLGYTWNSNSAATYNFVSGLVPPSNQWSFVALTISPTNAILYLYNTNGQLSATNAINHTNQPLAGLTFIGCDPSSSTTPQGRSFYGAIDEVAVFNHTLSPGEINDLYKQGLGIAAVPPVIVNQPRSVGLFEGRDARFTVLASGEPPLAYQWRKDGLPLSNGGNISGVNTPSLTISNVSKTLDPGGYDVVVSNVVRQLPSSVATLTVVASDSNPRAYEARLRAANPIAYWRMNETNGSPYAYDYWGGNVATNESVNLGLTGPVPPDFSGLEDTNTAGQYDGLSSYTASGASLINNRAQFSIMGWFNIPGNVGTRVGLFGQNDVAEFGFHGTDASGLAQLGMWTPNGAAYLSQTNVTLNDWFLIAGVATGTNVNLFLLSTNGGGGFQVLQATGTGNTTNYGRSFFPFRIGGGGILDASGNFFTGLIDEVAVFDRALSVSELSDLFGAALTGGDLAPGISVQPASQTLYAGRTATFKVSAVGTAPVYQWRTNGVPVSNHGNLSGATTDTLTITGIGASNAATFDVVITNRVGGITSSPAVLTVIAPAPGSYEAAIIAANPIAYYRLNDTNDPSGGTLVNPDFWGGHNGLYGSACSNGFFGILGPVPPLFAFEADNSAIQVFTNVPNSFATAPIGSLSTNTVTFTMWIKPVGAFDAYAGLLINRNSGVAGGFGYTGGQLGYTWNNNSGNTYNFRSGLVPPLDMWSFVALVVEPTQATLYMFNANGLASSNNILAHTSDVFGNNWQIGHDDNSNNNDGTRNFNGLIDEVAVFNYSLTYSQLLALYGAVAPVPVPLTIQHSGNDVVISWPRGTLLEAPALAGPWTTNVATSPYTNAPTGAQKFYRVIVR